MLNKLRGRIALHQAVGIRRQERGLWAQGKQHEAIAAWTKFRDKLDLARTLRFPEAKIRIAVDRANRA